MKSHNVLPIWMLWLTQGQGLTLPQVDETSAGSWDESHQEFKRDATDEYEYLTTYAKEDIIPVTETVTLSTSRAATGTALLLPTLSDVEPQTEGFIVTSIDNPLQTEGPLPTSEIPTPTILLQPLKSTTENAEASGLVKMAASNDIFANPIDTSYPLWMFERKTDHPVPRKGITQSGALETNKFYSNLFLETQTGPVFTFPYSVAWAAGAGGAASYGMAISHIEASQRAYGPAQDNNAVEFYSNPIGIQSMIISAKELGKNTVLTTDSIGPFSARAMLSKDSSSAPAISFPLVQGSVFTTAIFNGAMPFIQSSVYFRSMTRVSKDPKANVRKYNFVLEDGTTWRLYAYKTKGDPLDLTVVNNGLASSAKAFYGSIQIAKDSGSSKSEGVLDNGCGIYPTSMKVSGSAVGSKGTYSFTWSKSGHPTGNLWMFALPHHISSFDSTTSSGVRDYKLQTTTKGLATAVGGTTWTMVEPSMPVSMGFAPWSTTSGSKGLSTNAKNIIKPIAQLEISQDMSAQSDVQSMYFAGKALAKFGSIIYVINNLLNDQALAQAGLAKLKQAFALFGSNKQQYPLVYDKAWGGLVSSGSYITGESGVDFGNTYYNDHHFHYGYHVLAAAYIGSMDSKWLTANKAYVNQLIRDFANPSSKDKYFPQFRSFDWYHGHSWAHGLTAFWDGKDQESSSEDLMAAYAMKMWGQVIKDTDMVARANLQMAVMARSMQQYFYYTEDNVAQPSNFIGNKVAGILFENKIHHTTWFGNNIEFIQGIHMLPILPMSNFARTATFVKEEWDTYFSNGRIDKIDNAWKGIIYGNYATIEPKKAWDFFASSKFDSSWLDGGASRTWYLAYAGGEFAHTSLYSG
ncbi:hypothetical protein FZEAL_2046 [Fusarium zealandicum]|uniref:glucan endo-1,3-beta-D-glucosidase n=1 Tax=Fusarium zealandicum TaxID=1053134 RepID=A0A8H4US28_9HYPO|nr:hypothetical protein FZEAL_2046 [Fusarium zealandicum]